MNHDIDSHRGRRKALRFIAVFMILIMAFNDISIASDTGHHRSRSCLAPQSFLPEQSRGDSSIQDPSKNGISSGLHAGERGLNPEPLSGTSRRRSLFSPLINWGKTLVAALSFMMVLSGSISDVYARTFNDRVQAYTQMVDVMKADGYSETSVRADLLDKVRNSGDFAERLSSLNILSKDSPSHLEKIVEDNGIDLETRKAALLMRYNIGGNHDPYYLASVFAHLSREFRRGNPDESLMQTVLLLIKGELLSDTTELKSLHLKTPEIRTESMILLYTVISTENSGSLIREKAMQLFLSSFDSNQELAQLIVSFDESAGGNSIPVELAEGKTVIRRHGSALIKDAAQTELKVRILCSLLRDKVQKQHFGADETIEKIIDRLSGQPGGIEFARILLASAENHHYPDRSILASMPAVGQKVEKIYEELISEASNQTNTKTSSSRESIVVAVPSADGLPAALSGNSVSLAKETAKRLLEVGAAYTLLHSPDMQIRMMARDHVKNNVPVLLIIYSSADFNAEEKSFAVSNILRLLTTNPSEVQREISGCSASRDILIRLFRDVGEPSQKKTVLKAYFFSSPDLSEILDFLPEINHLPHLSPDEKKIMKDVAETEIQRVIAISILSRRAGILDLAYRPLTMHNLSPQQVKYHDLLTELKNPEKDPASILPMDLLEDVKLEYARLAAVSRGLSEDAVQQSIASGQGHDSQMKVAGVGGSVVSGFSLVKIPQMIFIVFPLLVLGLFRKSFSSIFERWMNHLGYYKNKSTRAGREPPERTPQKDNPDPFPPDGVSTPQEIPEGLRHFLSLMERADSKAGFSGIEVHDLNFILKIVQKHSKKLLFSAVVENQVMRMALSVLRSEAVGTERHVVAGEIFKVMLKVIHDPDDFQITESSPSPEKEIHLGDEGLPPRRNLFFNMIGVLTGGLLINPSLLKDLSRFENKKDGTGFSARFIAARKKVNRISLLLTLVQTCMVIMPYLLSLFSIVPFSMAGIWLVIMAFVILAEIFRQSTEGEISHVVDKLLAPLAKSIATKYLINAADLPTVNKITPGEHGRWFFIRVWLSGISISLGLLCIKPVFLAVFIPLFVFSWIWILYQGFSRSGIDEIQKKYQEACDRSSRIREIENFFSESSHAGEPAEKTERVFREYQNKNAVFTIGLFILIAVGIPLAGMFFGVTMYGLVLSGYLAFILNSMNPVKHISEAVYNVDKLRKILDYARNDQADRWERTWREREVQGSEDLLGKGWTIQEIRMDEMSLDTPEDNPKRLLKKQSLTIKKGKRLMLAAFSGAGKTQTGRMLAFLRPHNGGRILLKLRSTNGEERWIGADPSHIKLDSLRNQIRYYSVKSKIEATLDELALEAQGIPLTGSMPSEETKDFLFQTIRSVRESFIREALKILPELSYAELEQKMSGSFMNFSSGQRRRLFLVLILMKESRRKTPFLILDEPVPRIPGPMKARVCEYLKEWQKAHQVSLIVIDHHSRPSLEPDHVYSYSNAELIDYHHIEKQIQVDEIICTACKESGTSSLDEFIDHVTDSGTVIDRISRVFNDNTDPGSNQAGSGKPDEKDIQGADDSMSQNINPGEHGTTTALSGSDEDVPETDLSFFLEDLNELLCASGSDALMQDNPYYNMNFNDPDAQYFLKRHVFDRMIDELMSDDFIHGYIGQLYENWPGRTPFEIAEIESEKDDIDSTATDLLMMRLGELQKNMICPDDKPREKFLKACLDVIANGDKMKVKKARLMMARMNFRYLLLNHYQKNRRIDAAVQQPPVDVAHDQHVPPPPDRAGDQEMSQIKSAEETNQSDPNGKEILERITQLYDRIPNTLFPGRDVPEDLLRIYILFRVTHDMLHYMTRNEQHDFIGFLSRSNTIEYKLMYEIFIMIFSDEDYFMSGNINKSSLSDMFIDYICMMPFSDFDGIKTYIRQLGKNTLAGKLNQVSDEIIRSTYQQWVDDIYHDSKGRPVHVRIPKTGNLADYDHITRYLEQAGYHLDANLPKFVFLYKWPSFHKKAEHLRKQNQKITNASLRRTLLRDIESSSSLASAVPSGIMSPQVPESGTHDPEKFNPGEWDPATPQPVLPDVLQTGPDKSKSKRKNYSLVRSVMLVSLLGISALQGCNNQSPPDDDHSGRKIHVVIHTPTSDRWARELNTPRTSKGEPSSSKTTLTAYSARAQEFSIPLIPEFAGTVTSVLPDQTPVRKGQVLVRYDVSGYGQQLHFNKLDAQGKGLDSKIRAFDETRGTRTKAELTELELELQNNQSRQRGAAGIQMKGPASGVIKAPYDGVYVRKPVYADTVNTPGNGDNFSASSALGYLVLPGEINLEFEVMTANIYSLFFWSEQTPMMEITVNGGHPLKVKAKIQGLEGKPGQYRVSCLIPSEGMTPGDAPVVQVKVHESDENSHEDLSGYSLKKTTGFTYYPEKIEWIPPVSGVVSGIPKEAYEAFSPVESLAKVCVHDYQAGMEYNIHSRSARVYKMLYEKAVKAYGEKSPQAIDARTKYETAKGAAEIVASNRSIPLFHMIEAKKGWVITNISVYNGSLVGSKGVGDGKGYLSLANPARISVNTVVSGEFWKEISRYKSKQGDAYPPVRIKINGILHEGKITSASADEESDAVDLRIDVQEQGFFLENTPTEVYFLMSDQGKFQPSPDELHEDQSNLKTKDTLISPNIGGLSPGVTPSGEEKTNAVRVRSHESRKNLSSGMKSEIPHAAGGALFRLPLKILYTLIIPFIFILVVLVPSRASAEVTEKSVVDQYLANSPMCRIISAQHEEDSITVDQSRAGYHPKISAATNPLLTVSPEGAAAPELQLRGEVEEHLPGGGSVTGVVSSTTLTRTTGMGVTVRQPFLNGAFNHDPVKFQIEQSRSDVVLHSRMSEKQLLDQINKIRNLFWDLYQYEQMKKVLQMDKAVCQMITETEKRKTENDFGSEFDTLTARLKCSEVDRKINANQALIRSTAKKIAALTRIRGEEITVGDHYQPVLSPPPATKEIIRLARRFNPDLLYLQSILEKIEREKSQIRNQLLPSLDLTASYRGFVQGDPNSTAVYSLSGGDPYMMPEGFTVGVNLSFNVDDLFGFSPRSFEKKKTEARLARAKEESNILETELKAEAEALAESWKAAESHIRSLENAIPTAMKRYEQGLAAYQSGQKSILDLLKAEQEWMALEMEYVSTVTSLGRLGAAIDHVTGTSPGSRISVNDSRPLQRSA
ncbi:MAG: TolC family protein [Candidatus Aureabacteria bacterium]|nr:TolC family protein [Candidatus Auribacterota bacterium]